MAPSIPKTQTAAIVPTAGGDLKIEKNHPVTQPQDLKPGECLVKMSHTGVCHTDLHAKKGDWPVPAMTPLIGGHEGVGEIVAIGEHTQNSPVKVGDRVGIKWLADSCLNCEFCKKSYEMSEHPCLLPSPPLPLTPLADCQQAKLSGFTTDGTFAQYVVSYTNHVTPIPEGLNSADAASILCAGVTVYKALKVSNTKLGDWVVIPGAGGGLGHLAVQYANAMGLNVIAVDTGDHKRKLSLSLGAKAFVDFKTSNNIVDEIKDLTPDKLGAHAAVIAASQVEAYTQAVDYLRPIGTLVAVGLPNDKLGASVFFTVFKSIRIQGSYVGNRQDATESLEIAAAGKVKVTYDLQPLANLTDIYEKLEQGKIAGRIVLET
ncbi:alcohol dehydrogenase, propanol-preferring, partial [Tremellales sp. Uapishka_1]